MILALSVLALGFVACGGKTGATSEADSLVVEAVAPAEQAQQVVTLLQGLIQNADPEQVKVVGETITKQLADYLAAGNEEAATAYAATINQFVENNIEQIQQAGAANTIMEALSALQNLPTAVANSAAHTAADAEAVAAGQAAAAEAAVNATQQALEAAPAAAKAQAEAAAAAAQKQAQDAAAAAQKQAKDNANKAIDDAAAQAKKSLGLQ